MKINNLILFSILILLLSCSEKKKSNEIDLTETPETLNETSSKVSYSSISKRYGGNVVDRLYNEALEKNESLKQLNKQIKEITSDSLEQKTNNYVKYRNINNNYWNSIESYASNINDSITKQSILEIINKLKSSYEKRVSVHQTKMENIEKLKSKLKDQTILMKLFITEAMISNYQRNEIPGIIELESIINDYNSVIKKTEKYTKTKK